MSLPSIELGGVSLGDFQPLLDGEVPEHRVEADGVWRLADGSAIRLLRSGDEITIVLGDFAGERRIASLGLRLSRRQRAAIPAQRLHELGRQLFRRAGQRRRGGEGRPEAADRLRDDRAAAAGQGGRRGARLPAPRPLPVALPLRLRRDAHRRHRDADRPGAARGRGAERDAGAVRRPGGRAGAAPRGRDASPLPRRCRHASPSSGSAAGARGTTSMPR